jgi:hypothetical protein
MTAPAPHPHGVELRAILADFRERGIRPTPLNFISEAIARGLPEAVAASAAKDLERHLAKREKADA